MKIKVDQINKAVIATSTVYGKRIKGLAVAHDGDEFDQEFGTKLAKVRFYSKKYWAKAMYYEKQMRWNKKMIDDLKKENEQLLKFYEYNYDKSVEFDSEEMIMLTDRYPNM